MAVVTTRSYFRKSKIPTLLANMGRVAIPTGVALYGFTLLARSVYEEDIGAAIVLGLVNEGI